MANAKHEACQLTLLLAPRRSTGWARATTRAVQISCRWINAWLRRRQRTRQFARVRESEVRTELAAGSRDYESVRAATRWHQWVRTRDDSANAISIARTPLPNPPPADRGRE